MEGILEVLRERLGLIVLGLVIFGLFALTFLRSGSGVDPATLAITQQAVAIQQDAPASTAAFILTLTPAEQRLTGVAPTLQILGREEVRQYAAAATASSQLSELEWGAVQAVGPPNVEGCQSSSNAWAGSAVQTSITLNFAQIVRPTGIIVHQSYNPNFIDRIVITDLYGEQHEVYNNQPGPITLCPFTLAIPIDGADYPATTVTIFMNMSTSTQGINQIDAVELVGVRY
ncbi:MAG: hypothetical protein GYB64_10150 [Chloroflexi bacterium]|nr:hypothetical protein [Chloroflexota bacterium]